MTDERIHSPCRNQYTAHNFVDGICTWCGTEKPEEELSWQGIPVNYYCSYCLGIGHVDERTKRECPRCGGTKLEIEYRTPKWLALARKTKRDA